MKPRLTLTPPALAPNSVPNEPLGCGTTEPFLGPQKDDAKNRRRRFPLGLKHDLCPTPFNLAYYLALGVRGQEDLEAAVQQEAVDAVGSHTAADAVAGLQQYERHPCSTLTRMCGCVCKTAVLHAACRRSKA